MTGPLIQVGRLAYYVLFPYWLLVSQGVLPPQAVGVIGPGGTGSEILGWSSAAWVQALLWSVGWVAGLGLVLYLTWSLFARLMKRSGDPPYRVPGLVPAPSVGIVIGETAFLQAHWAFYRTAAILWLGPGGGPVWGPITAMAFLGLEAALDPEVWKASRYPLRMARIGFVVGIAWCSTGIFLATHNLWLSALAHGILFAFSTWLLSRRLAWRPGETHRVMQQQNAF